MLLPHHASIHARVTGTTKSRYSYTQRLVPMAGTSVHNNPINPHDRKGGGLVVCPIVFRRNSLIFREVSFFGLVHFLSVSEVASRLALHFASGCLCHPLQFSFASSRRISLYIDHYQMKFDSIRARRNGRFLAHFTSNTMNSLPADKDSILLSMLALTPRRPIS